MTLWAKLKKVTMPDGSYVLYTYDDAHRVADLGDSVGNKIHCPVDLRGNRLADQTRDPGGVLARQVQASTELCAAMRWTN